MFECCPQAEFIAFDPDGTGRFFRDYPRQDERRQRWVGIEYVMEGLELRLPAAVALEAWSLGPWPRDAVIRDFVLDAIFRFAPAWVSHLAVDSTGRGDYYLDSPQLDYAHQCWAGRTCHPDSLTLRLPAAFAKATWKKLCWARLGRAEEGAA